MRVVTLLRKEKTLPVKRKGLEGKVKSWFPAFSTDQRHALMQRLFDEKLVVEAETGLAFSL
jgi:hypothetical protein